MNFSDPTQTPEINAVVPGQAPVTSLSFHEDGQRLFAASAANNSLQIIDCFDLGNIVQPALKLNKIGVNLVKATHHEDCVLLSSLGSISSTTYDNAVHYLSVYDNKLLRAFRGHTDRITSISLSPADDTFVTASTDGTMRLWDITSAACVGLCQLPHDKIAVTRQTDGSGSGTGGKTVMEPLAVIDSAGLVMAFAAEMSNQQGVYLHLYDARNASAGPFGEFPILYSDVLARANSSEVTTRRVPWKTMSFDASGGLILVTAEYGITILLDGFSGKINHLWQLPNATAAACFSSDDKSVLQGYNDGTIKCLDVANYQIIKTFSGQHASAITGLACNPKYAQFASSCKDVALWKI